MGQRFQFDFQGEYNKLLSNNEYCNRKLAIETKSSARLEEIKNEISEIRQKIIKLERKKMNEIINKENIGEIFSITCTNEIGEVFSYNDVKSSEYFDLIKFLIRNGFIDETYPDYMTYFYEHSLSRMDKIFLRSVTDESAKEFSYKLKDPALVTTRLRDVDFEREEVLNFDLLAYLLESGHKKLNSVINQLKNMNRYDFLFQFWGTAREKKALVKTVNHIWPLFFNGIPNNISISDSEKQQYVLDSLYYSPDEDIIAANANNCMTSYISNNKYFLNIGEPDIPLIISKLRLLDVKFKQIDYESTHHSLFIAVYEADLYQVNISMISLILNNVYELPETEDYKHKNYTLVVSKPQEALAKYVKANFNQYIEMFLANCESKITDEEFAALIIINSKISVDHKLTYIKYLQTTIEKLENIVDKTLWTTLLEERKVLYTENNILQYYFNSTNGLNNILVSFVNNDPAGLIIDCGKARAIFGEDKIDSFYGDVIVCDDLLDEKYEMFIKSFDGDFDDFSFEGISDNKLKILIKHKIIIMNKTNLQFMREYYSDQIIFFIYTNIDLYANEVITDDNFEFSELVKLLDTHVDDLIKIKLLNYTSEPISIKETGYSESIKLHILKNNFKINDLLYLINNYEKNASNMKNMVNIICIEHVDQILNNEYKVPYGLLSVLLGSKEIEVEKKHELLVSQLTNLNEEQAKACLQSLDMTEVMSLFFGKWPKLERTEQNEKILSIFKRKGWITGFDIDKNDADYFRARGRKTREEMRA